VMIGSLLSSQLVNCLLIAYFSSLVWEGAVISTPCDALLRPVNPTITILQELRDQSNRWLDDSSYTVARVVGSRHLLMGSH
jgi:hypothetical protein